MSKFKAGDKVIRTGHGYCGVSTGGIYTVKSVVNGGIDLSLKEISGVFMSKYFELYKEPKIPNGVDGVGYPIFFDFKNDLKPFMRIITKSGECYIVCEGGEKGFAVRENFGFINLGNFDINGVFCDDGFSIIEIYDVPCLKAHTFNFSHKSKLLWKAKSPKTQREIAEEELTEIIKNAQMKLEELKGTK